MCVKVQLVSVGPKLDKRRLHIKQSTGNCRLTRVNTGSNKFSALKDITSTRKCYASIELFSFTALV
ncbi:hypothetical protein TSUD_260120 [Trifolium subterraneum]|uniref:Uncharacterized protein n=1 Tax=Trifolium subterraneum TaxID=3900 RepID=A0A2Z6M3E5_TRISU|nr:hypothetical protein TSUD_260120 [Trifolium subterraneum]